MGEGELYIGADIFDGKVWQQFYLTEDESLYEQRFYLHNDIGGVEYVFENGFEFVVDVSWHGDWDAIEEGNFSVRVFEGPKTEGKTFFFETAKDIKGLKIIFKKAIDLVQDFKGWNDQALLHYPEAKW